MSTDLLEVRKGLRRFSEDMECVSEGVVKNCSGCKGRHTWPFGKFCKTFLSNLAGEQDDDLLEGATGGQDSEYVVTLDQLKEQIETEKVRYKDIQEADEFLRLQHQFEALKLTNDQSANILQQKVEMTARLYSQGDGGNTAIPGNQSAVTGVSTATGAATTVTWSQTNMAAPTGAYGASLGPSTVPLFSTGFSSADIPPGVAQFPSQLWATQGASATPLQVPGFFRGGLQLPPQSSNASTWNQLIGGQTRSQWDQLIGGNTGGGTPNAVPGGLSSTGAGMPIVPPTLLPQSLLHQDWFTSDRSTESKGKRAKHWLRPDYYLPHDKKYDEVSYQELMFGMISVPECLSRYNIPRLPVLNYLEHLKFVAMKGMTASFSPEALARYEYLVTSKVLAGLLPYHIPANHEGVYTHLSAENVIPRAPSTPTKSFKKRAWFRCPRDICLKWNQGSCDKSDCGRKHICASCRGDHTYSSCKTKESKDQKST